MAIKALSVGDNCIDNYLPPINRRFAGGNGLNVAVYLKRGGVKSAYLGVVGEDENGRFILLQLETESVDFSHVCILPGITAITDIALKEGERIFVREEFGVVNNLTLDEEALNFITQFNLVHLSILGTTTTQLQSIAPLDTLISFDYSSPDRYDQAFLDSTLSMVDFAFFSGSHFRDVNEAYRFARLIQSRGPRLVIVTLGARGSIAYDSKGLCAQPAIQTKVIDTLGAGDAFIGGFLAGQLLGETVPHSLYRGAIAAADACTHYGAWLPAEHLR